MLRQHLSRTVFLALLITTALSPTLRADIYQWEWINPADPSQGKQQSTTLCPDGAGLVLGSGFYAYGKNLTQAYLTWANLTNVKFRYSTLTDADLTRANLTDANFLYSTLTDADLTGATIAGTSFRGTILTQAQFESTASYASGELTGIDLSQNDLSSWDFAGKNLTSTFFTNNTFSDTNFRGANLAYANFDGTWLIGLDMTGADARMAWLETYPYAPSFDNFVQRDGRVEGLEVVAGESFRVWDFDGVDTDDDGEPDMMLGITVGDRFAMDADGLLIVGLEDRQWGSTIAFDAGINVTFDGTLEIELRDDFVPMPGDQWQLFDFTGVTPTGDFDTYVLPSVANGQWDASQLLSDGILSFNITPPVPGDTNGDGRVDGSDVTILAGNWQAGVDDGVTATWAMGDFNNDGKVDGSDVTILAGNWQAGVTTAAAAVPEPSAMLLLATLLVAGIAPLRWRK